MEQEKIIIEVNEEERIVKNYLNTDGSLKLIPNKEKKKLAILRHVMKRFARKKEYTEKEVNEILKPVYGDYFMLRRELIDYKFMQREQDGSAYWVNQE